MNTFLESILYGAILLVICWLLDIIFDWKATKKK